MYIISIITKGQSYVFENNMKSSFWMAFIKCQNYVLYFNIFIRTNLNTYDTNSTLKPRFNGLRENDGLF